MATGLFNPYSGSLIGIALFDLGLLAVAYRRRSKRAAKPLVGMLACVVVWTFGFAVYVATGNEAVAVLVQQVMEIAANFVTLFVLLFALSYTGRDRWLSTRVVAILAGISAAWALLWVTNEYHLLMIQPMRISVADVFPQVLSDPKPAWYVYLGYLYGLLLVATAILGRKFLSTHRNDAYRGQTAMLLVGISLPWLANVLYFTNVLASNWTAWAFGITGIVFAVALFRYQLLDILPIARDVIVDTIDSGVLVVDDEDRVVDANAAFLRLFGFDAVPTAERIDDVFTDDAAVVETLGPVQQGTEDVTVRRDGDRRQYIATVSPIVDSVGSHLGRAFVFTDATERVRNRELLREQNRRLERQNDRLDRFAGTVSHDLRNPLNVVRGSVGLLREEGEADESHLERIETACSRMETLIDDVLTLARAGRTIDEKEPVALGPIVAESFERVRAPEVTLREELPSGMTVLGDPDRLRHALQNLLRNAVEHNDPPLAVTVGALRGRGDADAVGFYVEDDGAGIPPADHERVFEEGHTTSAAGTGFGLAIVRDVVDAHGWEIAATDGPAGGARFEITGVELLDG